jgi:hypothetical protein
MFRYLIEVPVENAKGFQIFRVEAESEDDALRRFRLGEGDFDCEEIEVTSLGNPTKVRLDKSTVFESGVSHKVTDYSPSPDIDAFQAWMEEQPHPQGVGLPRLALLGLNLGGECGEVIELLKKHLRDSTPMDRPHLLLELADVQIILAGIAASSGFAMSEVLGAGRTKIAGRMARGTMRGSGDDR